MVVVLHSFNNFSVNGIDGGLASSSAECGAVPASLVTCHAMATEGIAVVDHG